MLTRFQQVSMKKEHAERGIAHLSPLRTFSKRKARAFLPLPNGLCAMVPFRLADSVQAELYHFTLYCQYLL